MTHLEIIMVVIFVIIIACVIETCIYKNSIKYVVSCPGNDKDYVVYEIGAKEQDIVTTKRGSEVVVYKSDKKDRIPAIYNTYRKVIPRTLVANRITRPVNKAFDKLKNINKETVFTDTANIIVPFLISLINFPSDFSESKFRILTNDPDLSFVIHDGSVFIS